MLVSGTALALDRAGVDALRDKAIGIVETKGLDEGAKFLGDSANGFLDLKGEGLHTWAITRKGVIAFDHSGQTQPGMDVSDLTTVDGQTLVGKTFKAADKPQGGSYDENSWPHPTSGVLSNSYVSCGKPSIDKDLSVCAMAWIK